MNSFQTFEYKVVVFDKSLDRYQSVYGEIEARGLNKARIKVKKKHRKLGQPVHRFLWIHPQ